MASQRNEINYHHQLNDSHHIRCPAGSHIRSEGMNHTVPVDGSNAMLKCFPTGASEIVGVTVSSDRRNPDDCHLSDLALAAERARIEARKNHKRFMDAIYARRRRVREKEDEKELIKESESMQKVNAKLREENKKLESMVADAVVKIEAMGEKEMEWFKGVVEKANEKTKDSELDEANDQLVKKPAKRKLKCTEGKSKNSDESNKAVKRAGSSSKTKVEETTNGGVNSRYDISSVPQSTSLQLKHTTTSKEKSSSEQSRQMDVEDETSNRNIQRQIQASVDSDNEKAIQALREASYLQGLNDASLFNRRDVMASNPLSAQPSDLLNDPLQQHRVELERLLLVQRLNALRYPGLSVAHSDLSSLLDPGSSSSLIGGFNVSNLLSGNASAARYPSDTSLALAALQRITMPPPVTSPSSSILPGLTTAQLLAMSGVNDTHQLQMQMGILNAFERSNISNLNSLATLQLQQQQQQRQQHESSSSSSILAQLQRHLQSSSQQEQRHNDATNNSSSSERKAS